MFNWKINKKRYLFWVLSASMIILQSLALSAAAQTANKLFSDKCAGCHTIGGGALVGPDLDSVKGWKIQDLQNAVKRMEQSAGPLKDEEVNDLVAYLRKQEKIEKQPISDMTKSSPISSPIPIKQEPASLVTGKRLFYGDVALKEGGMSCIACHQSNGNGGNMGPELTAISKKFPGKALVNGIEKTPYRVMKSAYKDHPITHQEALDIAAFLETTTSVETKSMRSSPFALGAGMAVLVLGVIAFGYRNRKKSARANLKRRK
ncbi:c-type cytochrome [bacterium]|nr:c-type cytochrome [bacterium]